MIRSTNTKLTSVILMTASKPLETTLRACVGSRSATPLTAPNNIFMPLKAVLSTMRSGEDPGTVSLPSRVPVGVDDCRCAKVALCEERSTGDTGRELT